MPDPALARWRLVWVADLYTGFPRPIEEQAPDFKPAKGITAINNAEALRINVDMCDIKVGIGVGEYSDRQIGRATSWHKIRPPTLTCPDISGPDSYLRRAVILDNDIADLVDPINSEPITWACDCRALSPCLVVPGAKRISLDLIKKPSVVVAVVDPERRWIGCTRAIVPNIVPVWSRSICLRAYIEPDDDSIADLEAILPVIPNTSPRIMCTIRDREWCQGCSTVNGMHPHEASH